MANYFSDEQIQDMAKSTYIAKHRVTIDDRGNETFYTYSYDQLKHLMNLAVDTAKGEPIGTLNHDVNNSLFEFAEISLNVNNKFKLPKDTQLYNIKELPNG